MIKCQNFLCDNHFPFASGYEARGNCRASHGVGYPESCKVRKRYNRIWKCSYKSGKLRDERDKYYGRDK